jgi:transposase-like protein
LAVMMYVRFPLSLRQVEKLLHELMRKAMQRYGRPEVVVTDRHRCC